MGGTEGYRSAPLGTSTKYIRQLAIVQQTNNKLQEQIQQYTI